MWKSPALGNLAFKPNELKGLIQLSLEQIDLALSIDMPVTGLAKPYRSIPIRIQAYEGCRLIQTLVSSYQPPALGHTAIEEVLLHNFLDLMFILEVEHFGWYLDYS